jgi:hypothetical protein
LDRVRSLPGDGWVFEFLGPGGPLISALDFGRLNLDRGSLQTGDAGHFVQLDATFDEKGDRFLEESYRLILAEDRRPAPILAIP